MRVTPVQPAGHVARVGWMESERVGEKKRRQKKKHVFFIQNDYNITTIYEATRRHPSKEKKMLFACLPRQSYMRATTISR